MICVLIGKEVVQKKKRGVILVMLNFSINCNVFQAKICKFINSNNLHNLIKRESAKKMHKKLTNYNLKYDKNKSCLSSCVNLRVIS